MHACVPKTKPDILKSENVKMRKSEIEEIAIILYPVSSNVLTF